MKYVDGPHNLVKTIPAGTSLYRGRLLRDASHLFDDPDQMGAPSAEDSSAGRMSPAGIRMFYASADPGTAVAEIAAHSVQEFAQVATWTPTRDLLILDLTDRPAFPSAFDPVTWDAYLRLLFLREFASSITRPIVPDGRQHNEYAPTQVLTEYLRFVPRTKLDGIAYPSAQGDGKNYALFIQPDQLGQPVETLPLEISRASMFTVYRVNRTVTAVLDS